MTVVAPHRFEISQITADIAGTQTFTLDAHITTRDQGKKISDVLTVTLGGLVYYCHDAHVIRSFAKAWAAATDYASPVLPACAGFTGGPGYDRYHAGIIMRVAGTPARQPAITVVPTDASPTGAPYVQVGTGSLIVRAYDLAAVRSWAEGWATAEHAANRIWPDPDAFEDAETGERNHIARTGTSMKAGGVRSRKR